MSDHPEDLPPDLDDLVQRLRSERSELKTHDQDRIREGVFAAVRRRRQAPPRRTSLALRSRLIVGLTLLVIGASTAGTIAATGGGTSAQLNASVTQYNSQCAGPGGTQGADCSGNNLTSCANNCNGNNNTACAYNCFGNNNNTCTTYCVGNNNSECTSNCWGSNNPKCKISCHHSTAGAPSSPPNCTSGQSPSGGGQPGPPYPSCYEVAGAPPPPTANTVGLERRVLPDSRRPSKRSGSVSTVRPA